ncbi:hypothetical protein [Oleiagrimonas sp. MCCC 1A03011]|uniref:hypothetical protein n=1 Tax=Oleiagrimonas sp. MCCC 1A03011 TaxID=1926883 RepID=UPI000DC5EE9F|nr:hypothetical protein [Oleiagrimonas sp. MCCC 1A03011]RAP59704.1 hypothetical protein BTJ49_03450 [Oleiagrimonas sp. MCCC 1A03011]
MTTRKPHHDPVDESAWEAQECVWRAVREGRPTEDEDALDAALFRGLKSLPRPVPDADFASEVALRVEGVRRRRTQVRRFRWRVLGGLAVGYSVVLGVGLQLGGAGGWLPFSQLLQHGWVATALITIALFAVFDRSARYVLRPRG